jgi:para-aminobenzoate synthetase component 1
MTSSLDRREHESCVEQIKGHLGAGDCYQINLTRPVMLEGIGDAWPAWLRLRRLAGAPYGAWLCLSTEYRILCSSPELLLEVRGDCAVSEPIKGTRPRHPDPVVDHAMAGALRESDKDRAELTMIVDLVRNDLGRVAVPGTVTAAARRITAHANVHHASQRVSARLRPGEDAWSALAAVFPAGSVTGAPKIRATERIFELEPEPRGVYCGAIGFVSSSGNAAWNVAIRTGVWSPRAGGALRYHVGGGIVADSQPAEEWWETVAKGTAMARAFAGMPHPTALLERWPIRSIGSVRA